MIRLIPIACSLSLVFAQVPSTTDWRGLSPIKSTRMDVERALGVPAENRDNQRLTYYFADVVVYFYFTGNPKCQQKLTDTSWNVSSDTVTGIDVLLRHSKSLEETGIDLTKYKKIKGDYDVVNHYYFANTDEGFGIEVNNNFVKGYQYGPGSKLSHLRCPANKEAR